MISAFTILSNPDKYKYPWRESIKSFLPVVDELVVVYDVYSEPDLRPELKSMGVRIVSAIFDLRTIGWLSYGIMRTTGYQACKGDIVLMFDADGILHEKDIQQTRKEAEYFSKRNDIAYGYWGKYRTYSPTDYWIQNKHSGWYNKRILGDNFDFYHPNRKGIPNWPMLPEALKQGVQLQTYLYGYEHVWDTREVLEERIINYGHMRDNQSGAIIQTDEFYLKEYIDNLRNSMQKKGLKRSLEDHPAIIQDKLRGLTDQEFGYSYFNLI